MNYPEAWDATKRAAMDLITASPQGVQTVQIAQHLARSMGHTKRLLTKMRRDGLVEPTPCRVGAVWCLPDRLAGIMVERKRELKRRKAERDKVRKKLGGRPPRRYAGREVPVMAMPDGELKPFTHRRLSANEAPPPVMVGKIRSVFELAAA